MLFKILNKIDQKHPFDKVSALCNASSKPRKCENITSGKRVDAHKIFAKRPFRLTLVFSLFTERHVK